MILRRDNLKKVALLIEVKGSEVAIGCLFGHAQSAKDETRSSSAPQLSSHGGEIIPRSTTGRKTFRHPKLDNITAICNRSAKENLGMLHPDDNVPIRPG
jgi:hypothetical protein